MVWPLNATSTSATSTEDTTPKDELLILANFPDVFGTVTEPGYEGWVQLTSFNWGVGLGISSGRWNSDDDDEKEEDVDETVYPDRECSEPSISEVSLSKASGPDSVHLLHGTFSKKAWDVITIVFLAKSASPNTVPKRAVAYRLYRTLISGFSVSGGSSRYGSDSSSNSPVSESISLNYGGVEILQYAYGTESVDVTSVHHHLGTGTTTLKIGKASEIDLDEVVLEVVSVKKKEKKEKKDKKKDAEEVKEPETVEEKKDEGESTDEVVVVEESA